jgi:diguanylate cyclase
MSNDPISNLQRSTPQEPPMTLDAVSSDGLAIDYGDLYGALRDATVMMIDDEPTTIEVLQAFLESEGYKRFITTSDSTRAMEMIVTEDPDVLLLDLHMPQVTGFEILTMLRRDMRFRHTPVIVLTSATDSDTKLKALQLGASDFLAKPVDPSELALRLRNTLAAKAYQDRLTFYDSLTGLPNRRLFMDRLLWSLRCARRENSSGAILHIDLDQFKKINDTLGHEIGDHVLVEVGRRLLGCVAALGDICGNDGADSEPLLSRVGGDEFNLLLPIVTRVENAVRTASKILAAMKEPFSIDAHEVFLTASIGVAIFPNDGDSADALLKHTGVAMNQAKRQGRNTYEFYSPKMNARALERLKLENELRRALDRDELLAFYQPKVDVHSGRIVGAEVLLRWNHPQRGFVSPVEFIPLAEENGMIVEFGEWILRAACRQNKTWQDAGLPKIRVAVNVSARQFRDGRFLETLRQALDGRGLEPQFLTLELTENTIMENAQENLDTLHAIKEMGIKLSVDDFGTGYSSLSYLKQLPLDELKIDRSFIIGIRSENDDAPIVTSIISMAHSLNLRVVMEGIETERQLIFCSERGCDEYQGFLFSKPVPEGKFKNLLEAGTAT